MSFVRCLRSTRSGDEFDPEALDAPAEGRPYELIIDIDRVRRERGDGSWYYPTRKDMWRFGGLLPLDVEDPADRPFVTSRGEGYTPLIPYPSHSASESGRFRLLIKDEGDAHEGYGANPTRSFKDRGMAMTVSMARRHGVRKLAIPTQGNAGDALVEYAVAGGLDVVVAAPATTPRSILDRIRAEADRRENVHLELVDGTIREAAAVIRERFAPEGYYNVATFLEPGWRIEGKKTMGYELAEAFGWELPDVVVYPTGGGTGILGMWKAFGELEELGMTGAKRPKMMAVQSAATAPVVRAFEAGEETVDSVEPGETVATGLNVPGGVGHDRVLQIIRVSGGAAVAVSDEAIHVERRRAAEEMGVRMCPEGAACLAALQKLVDRSLIGAGDRVVVFNTASGEKY